MSVLVNNIQDQMEVPEELLSLLEDLGNFVLRLEGQPQESEVSVILVDNNYIQELNLTYRGFDSPTDVLSFNLQDDVPKSDPGEDKILGDVVISIEKAVEQADLYGHSLRREVAFLAAHGILHLLGYDHETPEAEQEMKEKKNLILKKFML
jgi:probable rRNA maturation factor